jgi:hypothetical protein
MVAICTTWFSVTKLCRWMEMQLVLCAAWTETLNIVYMSKRLGRIIMDTQQAIYDEKECNLHVARHKWHISVCILWDARVKWKFKRQLPAVFWTGCAFMLHLYLLCRVSYKLIPEVSQYNVSVVLYHIITLSRFTLAWYRDFQMWYVCNCYFLCLGGGEVIRSP